jgi:thiol-disulfide isomerase/thioredoxin
VIDAPPFPPNLPWANVATLRLDQQRGRPVLIEFWDFCRPNCLRTLPYLRAWHARYEQAGLRVIGVHSPGFPPSADPDNVRAAIRRLRIDYPVLIDTEFVLWQEYQNLGWPARYLWDAEHHLLEYHYGEGAYAETELAIQELLGVEQELLEPLRPEDAPGAPLLLPSDPIEGPWSGDYEAGAVWAVLEGSGEVAANGSRTVVEHPAAYELISHPVHTSGHLELTLSDGVTCHAVIFTAGLDPDRAGSPARAQSP